MRWLLVLVFFLAAPAYALCPDPVDPNVENPYSPSEDWCAPDAAARCELRFQSNGLTVIVERTNVLFEEIFAVPAPSSMWGLGLITSQCFDDDDVGGFTETWVARFRGPRAPLWIP